MFDKPDCKDPWLEPGPSPRVKELETLVLRQQKRLDQQEQLISVLLFQLSQPSETARQSFDDLPARAGREPLPDPLPENVVDLHEWLNQKYPF